MDEGRGIIICKLICGNGDGLREDESGGTGLETEEEHMSRSKNFNGYFLTFRGGVVFKAPAYFLMDS